METTAPDCSETRPVRHCFDLGLRHGLSCVGSCGALMLLMFAVDSAHLFWMAMLAGVMIAEKNTPWGLRMAKPLGSLLLVGAVCLLLLNRH